MSKDSQADTEKPTAQEKSTADKASSETKPVANNVTTQTDQKTSLEKSESAATNAATKPTAADAATKPATNAATKPTAADAATKPATNAATKPTAAKKPVPAKRTVAKKPAPPAAPIPEFEKAISDKIMGQFGSSSGGDSTTSDNENSGDDNSAVTTVESTFIKPGRIGIKAGRENVHKVAEFIRDDLGYDHVESVSGVDYPADGEIEVVYHIGSYTNDSLSGQIIALSTRAQREDDPIPGGDATRLPSLRDVFYSVEFHEREIFEMLGVYFEGHPDNRRLLLPEDWADLPPMRKDFAIKGR